MKANGLRRSEGADEQDKVGHWKHPGRSKQWAFQFELPGTDVAGGIAHKRNQRCPICFGIPGKQWIERPSRSEVAQ